MLFAISLTGLIWALMVDGAQDWVAAALAGAPIIAIAVALSRRAG